MPEVVTVALLDKHRRPYLMASALGDPQETAAALTVTAKRLGLPEPADIAAAVAIACRGCGCTDDNACMTAAGPCEWVEPDLCSVCAQKTVLRP